MQQNLQSFLYVKGVDKSKKLLKYVDSIHAHGDEPLSMYLLRVFVLKKVQVAGSAVEKGSKRE